jgi:hypothetical protein
VLAGSGLAGAALFLTQVRFPVVGSVNGIDGDAWPVLIPLAPLLLLTLFGDRVEGYRPAAGLLGILFACAAVVFAAIKTADAVLAARSAGGSVGAGPWLVLAATAVVVVGTVLGMSRRLR